MPRSKVKASRRKNSERDRKIVTSVQEPETKKYCPKYNSEKNPKCKESFSVSPEAKLESETTGVDRNQKSNCAADDIQIDQILGVGERSHSPHIDDSVAKAEKDDAPESAEGVCEKETLLDTVRILQKVQPIAEKFIKAWISKENSISEVAHATVEQETEKKPDTRAETESVVCNKTEVEETPTESTKDNVIEKSETTVEPNAITGSVKVEYSAIRGPEKKAQIDTDKQRKIERPKLDSKNNSIQERKEPMKNAVEVIAEQEETIKQLRSKLTEAVIGSRKKDAVIKKLRGKIARMKKSSGVTVRRNKFLQRQMSIILFGEVSSLVKTVFNSNRNRF